MSVFNTFRFSFNISPTFNRKLISILSNMLPETFTNIAFDKLTNPQLIKLRDSEQGVLDLAQQSDIAFREFRIRTYHWSGEGESVLLIHGWEGQAGNFSDLIEKLIAKGFNIHAFDAPAHGYSSKGTTNPIEFSDLVAKLLHELQVDSIISHSFGGVAVSYALFQNPLLSLKKAVLVTTPDRFVDRISDVAQRVGVSDKVQQRLIERLQAENIDVEAFNVSDFVKSIKVESALILHDKDDRVIPIHQSKNVHSSWPQAQFVEIEGTGHFRILRTPEVLDRIVAFIHPDAAP